MTDKTLTDELRSVLMFHALEAPEPHATLDRILAETVGPVTALGLPDEPPVASTAPNRRRRLSIHQLAVAAVIAVLLLSVAGVNSLRNRDATSSGAQASRDQVGQDRASQVSEGQAGQGQAGQDQAGQQPPSAAAGSLVPSLPSDTAAAQSRPAQPPAYAGKGLNCSTIPGGKLMIGQSDHFLLSTDVEGYLYEYLCVGPNGQRSGSEVQMFQLSRGAWRYVRTLAHPSDGEHLDAMSAGRSAYIQFSVHRGDVPGEIRATVEELSDPQTGRSQSQSPSWTVAEPCLREDLAVTVTPAPQAAAPSWLLSVRNQGRTDPVTGKRTERACALEGFAQVRAQRDGATLATAAPTLNGPAGGVRKQSTPPIIVLSPDATASAVIEQSTQASGACLRSDRLAVTLPNGVSLGQVQAQLPGCALVVHPLVGNATGSG